MFRKVNLYLKESIQEFGRINWPTRKQTALLVGVVILVSLALAFYLGALDFAFVYLIEQIII
ncbi:MAG: preprotein translocase subunit SecE [Candidatus Colwellbacteria bacterium CG10_big_fil_rev_8_21_14_0_10_41_28]|uniref:Protein translocase subunit SecE n=1 Tax=Candidatus Colwellbacteria bacterium CG10_big_fil_rev_8_21_14_0_10_41_28 TaxID=1974539 RepID=A0A2H0VJM9_9BACT|nr:MAG: preprotein translocase subunit SecE [Candidatus Colwellbacteria bacterium CG10_big_fil_rev_8_21_14_0_10_41_28]